MQHVTQLGAEPQPPSGAEQHCGGVSCAVEETESLRGEGHARRCAGAVQHRQGPDPVTQVGDGVRARRPAGAFGDGVDAAGRHLGQVGDSDFTCWGGTGSVCRSGRASRSSSAASGTTTSSCAGSASRLTRMPVTIGASMIPTVIAKVRSAAMIRTLPSRLTLAALVRKVRRSASARSSDNRSTASVMSLLSLPWTHHFAGPRLRSGMGSSSQEDISCRSDSVNRCGRPVFGSTCTIVVRARAYTTGCSPSSSSTS